MKPSGTLAPTNLKGKMELKDVSFSYPNSGNSLVLKVGGGNWILRRDHNTLGMGSRIDMKR